MVRNNVVFTYVMHFVLTSLPISGTYFIYFTKTIAQKFTGKTVHAITGTTPTDWKEYLFDHEAFYECTDDSKKPGLEKVLKETRNTLLEKVLKRYFYFEQLFLESPRSIILFFLTYKRHLIY